jgi:hypothetical protein
VEYFTSKSWFQFLIDMSFYMYLPSNGSQRYFPEHKISKYRIKTPSIFEFKHGEYEVALAEITYTSSLKILTGENNDNIFHIQVPNSSEIEVVLPTLPYASITHLVERINAQITEHKGASKYVQLEFAVKQLKRVSITLDNKATLKISQKLSYILGFDGKTEFVIETSNKQTYYATTTPNRKGGCEHMFIYSDIVQPQVVGSNLVPLLRMINLKGEENETITTIFPRPYYLPLARNVFDIISVVLCNEFGEELHMHKGQVTIVLHFKKRGELQ